MRKSLFTSIAFVGIMTTGSCVKRNNQYTIWKYQASTYNRMDCRIMLQNCHKKAEEYVKDF